MYVYNTCIYIYPRLVVGLMRVALPAAARLPRAPRRDCVAVRYNYYIIVCHIMLYYIILYYMSSVKMRDCSACSFLRSPFSSRKHGWQSVSRLPLEAWRKPATLFFGHLTSHVHTRRRLVEGALKGAEICHELEPNK